MAYTRGMTVRSQRLSAGVVVVRRQDGEWRYLLLRAFNHWDFPKGMVEEGEEPLAAAVREVKEESTLDDLDFAWGDGSTQTGPYSGGKVARYYIAETRREDVASAVQSADRSRRAQRIPLGRSRRGAAARLAAREDRPALGGTAAQRFLNDCRGFRRRDRGAHRAGSRRRSPPFHRCSAGVPRAQPRRCGA